MRQTTSAKERFEATAFLHTVCHRAPSGLAEYKPGWDDQKVALHTNVSVNVISYARQQTIGRLHVKNPKPIPQPPSSPDVVGYGMEARMIADIRQHIKRLEEQNDLLEKRVKQLEDVYTRPQGASNGLPRY